MSILPSSCDSTERSWMPRFCATAATPAVRQLARPTRTYSIGVIAAILGGEDLRVVGLERRLGLVRLLLAEAEEALDVRLAVGAVLPLAGRPPRELRRLGRALQRLARVEQRLDVDSVVRRCHSHRDFSRRRSEDRPLPAVPPAIRKAPSVIRVVSRRMPQPAKPPARAVLPWPDAKGPDHITTRSRPLNRRYDRAHGHLGAEDRRGLGGRRRDAVPRSAAARSSSTVAAPCTRSGSPTKPTARCRRPATTSSSSATR